jgi:hypothetical protein
MKLYQKLLGFILSVIMLVSLVGCCDTKEITVDSQSSRFETVEQVSDGSRSGYRVLLDKETGIMYIFYSIGSGDCGRGGITVLLDNDGEPMSWEEYCEERVN